MTDEQAATCEPEQETTDQQDAEQINPETEDELRAEIVMLRKHDEDVRHLADEVAELERDHESSKKETAERKKALDASSRHLRILAQTRPTAGPLFDQDEEPSDDESQPGDWHDVTLEELGIDGKPAEIFTSAGLATLGDIAEWSGHNRFETLTGIGEKTADELREKLVAYWTANPLPEKTDDGDTDID